jgi:hypothetical protein
MRWVESAALYALTAGALYLILAYIGDLPMRQSVVLALVLAPLARGIATAAPKPTYRFSPYCVHVYPNWHQLLTDFHLIDKPEDWGETEKSFEALPSTDYRVLRNGVRFTVVHQAEDSGRTVIYSDSNRVFVSRVDFLEKMEPLRIRHPQLPPTKYYEGPYFFVKSTKVGYALGIEVPDWWWREVKASSPAPVKEQRGELTLATISYREFDRYWKPVKWSRAFEKQIKDRRDDQRNTLGWKPTVERQDEGESIQWTESIEHKYFRLEHRAI